MTENNAFFEFVAERVLPNRFVAAQLRQPSGPFGRFVLTRVLNRRNAKVITSAVDALELRAHDRFLDLGFGGGRGIELAAERCSGALLGVDFSADVVVAGMRRFETLIRAGRLNLLCADVAELPLRDALVSAICSTHTLYFWPDPQRGLEGLRRVLESNGRLALGYSGRARMEQLGRITRHGFTLYEPDQVESLVRGAGFSQVRTQELSGGGDYVTLAVA